MNDYSVIFYRSGNASSSPIREFIQKLGPSSHAKTLRLLDLLRDRGPELGMPYSRALGKGLFELRVRDKQEVRLLYVFLVGKRIFVVHVFQKKTQQTPSRELDIARSRQKELTNI